MSEFQLSTERMTVYAIKGGRPPDVWFSDWTLLNGERIGGGDVPEGFRVVSETDYQDAVRAQEAARARNVISSDYAYRQTLSTRRRELVATGLSIEQVRILVPDPENDYSIDDDA